MSESTAELDCRQHSQRKTDRVPHENVWREVFRYMAPERAHGFGGETMSAADIQARKAEIYDSTAIDAGRLAAAGMASGMHGANSIWFGLDVTNATEEEKRWLEMSARVLFDNIHASNFDAAAGECHSDMVPAGWFVLYVDEKPEGGFDFQHWPMSQCYIACSKPGGRVDIISREFELTIEQLVNEYGLENLTETIREKYRQGDMTTKYPVVWTIKPRQVRQVSGSGAQLAKNKPFASRHHLLGEKHLMRESGYDEFPCMVPRWRSIPGTPYATGMGSDALPDVKTLNDIQRLELANLDIAVSGMWKAVDDGVLNPKTVRLGPRKIVMMADLKSMEALTSGADFNVSFAKADQLRASIRKILLADQLQPQDGPAMTATEVHTRVQLIRQQMGPIFARLQSEFLQPLIERCFAIAYRAGILGSAPQSLRDRSFTVKYISPLARAQRLEEVTAIDTFLAGLAEIDAIDSTVKDMADIEGMQREKASALGVPAKYIRSRDQVAEKRKQMQQARESAQQQQAQQQLGMEAGQALINNFAKAA